MKFVVLT